MIDMGLLEPAILLRASSLAVVWVPLSHCPHNSCEFFGVPRYDGAASGYIMMPARQIEGRRTGPRFGFGYELCLSYWNQSQNSKSETLSYSCARNSLLANLRLLSPTFDLRNQQLPVPGLLEELFEFPTAVCIHINIRKSVKRDIFLIR